MDEGRNMILLFPTLINFKSPEDRKNFDISCHMFYPRRVLDINDGKPKWSGINDNSELLEEGTGAHKKRKVDAATDGAEKKDGEEQKK